jgi:hypothetical protein
MGTITRERGGQVRYIQLEHFGLYLIQVYYFVLYYFQEEKVERI